jgi:hypothetical protein
MLFRIFEYPTNGNMITYQGIGLYCFTALSSDIDKPDMSDP